LILKTAVEADCIAWADKSAVIPAQAGIQESCDVRGILDSRLRGNDGANRLVWTHPSGESFSADKLLFFIHIPHVHDGQLRFPG
jgi:hypothetical protein